MSLKRGLLIGIGLLVVVAAATGAFIQLSTSQTLQRAEALQFRRMLVNRLDGGDAYRFFFVTNRREEARDAGIDERFGNVRDERLTFGRFDTSIEPSLGLGMLIDPTAWFQNEEIQLLDVRSLERDGLVDEVRSQVDASPGRSLLIVVQGFRDRFPTALRKTAFLAHVLDLNTPVLAFDWPGDQGSTPAGYRRAQAAARESGDGLAQMIALILREVAPDNLSILANSMGGEVVVSAFTRLYREADMADAAPEFRDVILTAPDVSHEQFGAQFRDEISALSEELTVYVSSNDRALLMSRLLNRGRRLGESTLDPGNPDQSDEALEVFELVEPGNRRVELVDVTPVNRTRNFHNFSLETPEVYDDIYLRLSARDTPNSRLRYRVLTPSGKQYWVLTRGR